MARPNLVDPDSAVGQRPDHDTNEHRPRNPEYFVAVGTCTHRGCSPGNAFDAGDQAPGADWPWGFLCPCHGATSDFAGCVFKGMPAPTHLGISPHTYLPDSRLITDTDQSGQSRSKGRIMKIAVTSQNRKTITEHAGKCRRFWIYEIEKGLVVGKSLVGVSMHEVLHANHQKLADPLAGINVLIAGGMGPGLFDRLMQGGILPVITLEEDPDAAVAALLANNLDRLPVRRSRRCREQQHALG